MKYNININQLVLSKYRDFDLVDCAILDYLIVLGGSQNPRVTEMRIDGYTWVDYQRLIDDNPLLRITSKGAITKRMQKLVDAGFIKTKEIRKNGHKLIYFMLTSLVDTLFIQMNRDAEPIHSGEKPIHENEPIIILNNNNTKYNNKERGQCAEIPNNINKDAWSEWVAYRKEIRKKMTDRTCKMQWRLLGKYDFATQKQIIEKSITNGWTGLFEPKGQPAKIDNKILDKYKAYE